MNYKTLEPEQIINISKKRGYKFKKFKFFVNGKYTLKDSMFNHRDISHYNVLHKKMAKNMKHEVIHQGNITTFLRYYQFFGISFPMVANLMDTKPNQIVEVFTSILFHFIKVNTEHKIDDKNTSSVLEFYVGCKSKILLFLVSPLIKKIVKDSFDDFINEDVPFMEIRENLREKGYRLSKDVDVFNHYDTSNLKSQNIHITDKVAIPNKNLTIDINDLEDNKVKKINNIDITGFQIFKKKNIIKIFPRLCPHEGGCLDIDNSYGGGVNLEEFMSNNKVKCTVHNRQFDPMIIIDLENLQNKYQTNLYTFKVEENKLIISFKNEFKNLDQLDWSK